MLKGDEPMIRRMCFNLLFLLFSLPLMAEDVVLNPNHPQQYEVVRGDTLWDISALFLQHPWDWPEIWYVNPQIDNPHLIYPGDIISLVYRDGRPVLEVSRGLQSFKLSPEIRELELDLAIRTIPLSAIKPFLKKPRIVSEETLALAPYVVAAMEERLASGAGDKVYVRGLTDEEIQNYSVFKTGEIYHDPVTKELLGYEAVYLADGWVEKFGDPAKMELRSTNREVLIGNRLLPVDEDDEYDLTFMPRLPDNDVNGQILAVADGLSQIGQYQVVVINRGSREGMEVGHVLLLLRAGDTIEDKVTAEKNVFVTLPDEFAGAGMAFKIFEKLSYVIVMKANQAMHVGDKISTDPDKYSTEINALFKGRD